MAHGALHSSLPELREGPLDIAIQPIAGQSEKMVGQNGEKSRDRPRRRPKATWLMKEVLENKLWQVIKSIEATLKKNQKLERTELNELRRTLDTQYVEYRDSVGMVPADIRRAADRLTDLLEYKAQEDAEEVEELNDRRSTTNRSSYSGVSGTSERRLELELKASRLRHEVESRKQEEDEREQMVLLEMELQKRKEALKTRAIERDLAQMEEQISILDQDQRSLAPSKRIYHTESDGSCSSKVEREKDRVDISRRQEKDRVDISRRQDDVSAILGKNRTRDWHVERKSAPQTHLRKPNEIPAINSLTQALAAVTSAPRLPAPEPSVFKGDPLQYPRWRACFDGFIHERPIPDVEKLFHLERYLEGEPKEACEGFFLLGSRNAYEKARKHLNKRYGASHVVADSFRSKLENWPKVSGKDSKGLVKFANFLQHCLAAKETVKGLGILDDVRENMKLVSKLPDWAVNGWTRIVVDLQDKEDRHPDFAKFVEFVEREARICTKKNGLINSTNSGGDFSLQIKDSKLKRNLFATDVVQHQQRTDISEKQQTKAISKGSSGPSCLKCQEKHYLNQCSEFRAMLVKDRIAFVREKRLCNLCFKGGHRASECTKTWTCDVDGCGRQHNRWLHIPTNDGRSETHGKERGTDQATAVTTAATCVGYERIALPVKEVQVRAANGQYIKVFALHDNCSNTSLCTDSLIERLGLPTEEITCTLTTVSSSQQSIKCRKVDLDLSANRKTYRMVDVVSRPTLNMSLDGLINEYSEVDYPHFQGLGIPNLENIAEVDLLIGQDNPQLLIPLEVREGRPGEPYAVKTWCGWGFCGPFPGQVKTKKHELQNHFIAADLSLNQQVEKMWQQDEPYDQEPAYSINDKKVIDQWRSSIHKEGSHYSMCIPFKSRPPNLPDNHVMVEHRLNMLRKRLKRDEDLQEKYVQGMNDMICKGYAEEVPSEELARNDGFVWYLPHHPVTNPKKPGKVRLVFDCAARCQGVSLNDQVYQGPDMTNKLIGVLLMFRQDEIAFMADIEGMFNQVKVHQHDRDMLRFLWWKDGDLDQVPNVYRMTTHLFGGVWSPSCANFALRETAIDHGDSFHPETVKAIKRNFYVDDCLKSLPSVELVVQIVQELTNLLQMGGFRLTKFLSSSRDVLKAVPESERCKKLAALDFDVDLPKERALGVLWDVEEDCFSFETLEKKAPLTKRGLLSVMSSIYDPLGFVSPFVLQAKRLFQLLCRLQIGWDETMPTDVKDQWMRWQNDVSIIAQMKIPRCLKANLDVKLPTSAQLHIFSDASEVGLGAVAYLRVMDSHCDIQCTLVMAKAKLAPLKGATIPRLELAAAVVALRLNKYLCEYLELAVLETTFWTDSMIVLQYLRNEDKRYKTFVSNRVAEIRSYSNIAQWKHVESASNAADDVSRGMSAEDLIASQRWLQGPEFLYHDEDKWPSQPLPQEFSLKDLSEVKKEQQIYVTVQDTSVINELLERYSSWIKLKRAVAWILRLKDHLRHASTQTGLLTVQEMKAAEKAIVVHVQQHSLSSGNNLAKLCPINEDSLLRVGGRLCNSHLPFSTRHPMILPKDHPVTELIVKHYHDICGHGGAVRVLAEMRQKFWPVNGHATVKRVLGRCVKCKKMRASVQEQQMASLPEDRVTSSGAAFARVGVDYFGPLMVRRGRSDIKRYGCLFTCLVTRAIHLEVAASLDTDSFLQALQRFMARRGKPEMIRSDNGTNFVGAKGELTKAIAEWNHERISNTLVQKDIMWQFNTPGASHMGGVWERQIRTIRSVMLGLVMQQRIDDESLSTLLCNVEAIVNGRPITKLTEDPNDPRSMSPNDLLLLKTDVVLPLGKFTLQDLYRKKWKQVQYLADIFWTRWTKEYLPTLQERNKWTLQKRNLRKGDLVLVKDQNCPRNRWPLGLIVEPHAGTDGLVRSVTLKTQSGTYDRPIAKLCLLEGQPDD